MTHIILDTNDEALARDISDALPEDSEAIRGLPWPELSYDKNHPTYVFYGEKFQDTPEDRMIQVGLASSGVVLLSEKEVNSPLYAGKIPGVPSRIDVHLKYSMSRAKEFRIDGITYTGPVLQDPKNVVILDDGRSSPMDLMHTILKNSAPKWWPSVGYIREFSDDALSEALEDQFYYSAIVCLSEKTFNRVKSLGRDDLVLYDESLDPSDRRFSMKLRGLTARPDTFDAELDRDRMKTRKIIGTTN